MGVQGAVQATVTIKEESTFGQAAGAASGRVLRRVSSSLTGSKGSFASNEVRQDLQVSEMRHGGRSVGGNIETELALTAAGLTYEDMIQAVLRGTWTNGVSVAPADFATGVTVATSGGTSTLTFAGGGGNLLTKGFRIGDVVRCTGLTSPANNNKNFRIVALTSTVMTVAAVLNASAQQATGWAVTVAGKKLLVGTTKRSFTIEQSFADAAAFELFTGCRLNDMTLGAQPNGMVSLSFGVMGQNFTFSGASYFNSPTPETVGGNLSSVQGAVRVNGADIGFLTGLQMNVTNNCSMPPVIGSVVAPEIFYGRLTVTGSLTFMLDNLGLLNAFDQEQEIDVVALFEAAGANPPDFYCLNMQRVKISGAQKTLGPDGAVIVQAPFQALLASGTGKDVSTLVIQRSNTAV